jgi:hypothetical protein
VPRLHYTRCNRWVCVSKYHCRLNEWFFELPSTTTLVLLPRTPKSFPRHNYWLKHVLLTVIIGFYNNLQNTFTSYIRVLIGWFRLLRQNRRTITSKSQEVSQHIPHMLSR